MNRVVLNLKIALRSLYSFKLRTSLAVLGVFLGTFSLILVYNLAGSLARKGEMEIEKLGKNMLIVRSGTVIRHGPSTRLLSQAANLTLDDAAAIVEAVPWVQSVTPSSSRAFPSATVTWCSPPSCSPAYRPITPRSAIFTCRKALFSPTRKTRDSTG